MINLWDRYQQGGRVKAVKRQIKCVMEGFGTRPQYSGDRYRRVLADFTSSSVGQCLTLKLNNEINSKNGFWRYKTLVWNDVVSYLGMIVWPFIYVYRIWPSHLASLLAVNFSCYRHLSQPQSIQIALALSTTRCMYQHPILCSPSTFRLSRFAASVRIQGYWELAHCPITI